jgi:hypothetical protein
MGEVLDGGDHLGGPQMRGVAVSGASLLRGGGGVFQRLDDTMLHPTYTRDTMSTSKWRGFTRR